MYKKNEKKSTESENNYSRNVGLSIKYLIDSRFSGVVSRFADLIGEDRKRIDIIISGTQKNGPSADILGKVFDAFPDVTARMMFHAEFSTPFSDAESESHEAAEASVMYVKNNTHLDEKIFQLRAQLSYMTSMYENTLAKLVLLQNQKNERE